MNPVEAFRTAISAVAANKLRSLLTMLGIVIGVAAVIVMVAIGSGARQRVVDQVRSLGANLAIIQAGTVTQGGVRLGFGASSTLTDDDAAAIKKEIEGVTGGCAHGARQCAGRGRRQQLGHRRDRQRCRLSDRA